MKILAKERKKMDKLTQENAKLREEIEALRQDDPKMEKSIRQRLGYGNGLHLYVSYF